MAKKVLAPRAKKRTRPSKPTRPTRPSRPVRPVRPVRVAKPVRPTKPVAAPRSDAAVLRHALEAGQGIFRLAPTWVPRSFLMPGRRLRLAPQDLYALGAHRGGIDERWFASTTPAANEGAPPDEGLSHVVYEAKRAFPLRDAVAQEGPRLIGPAIWERYRR